MISEAIPTEYAGVVFRSKSEAIFAKALEIAGLSWEYEPNGFVASSGWTPDFLVVAVYKRPHSLRFVLVEYKPSEPTDTYKNQLFNKFKEADKGNLCHYVLFSGSPFNDDPKIMLEYGRSNGVIKDQSEGWLATRIIDSLTEAKNTRFDLANT